MQKNKKLVLGILIVVLVGAGIVLLVNPGFVSGNSNPENVAGAPDSVPLDGAEAYAASLESGKEVFSLHCMRCHGSDGNAGFQGAKPLSQSRLEPEQIQAIVRNGKGLMPPNSVLSDEEMKSLTDYVKYLRK